MSNEENPTEDPVQEQEIEETEGDTKMEEAAKEEGAEDTKPEAPTEGDEKMEELAKEEGEIDESTEQSMDVDQSTEEKAELSSTKDDSKDVDESESPSQEEDGNSCPEKEEITNKEDEEKQEDDLNEFLAHWKKAVELKSAEEIEKIYDDLLSLVAQFSLEFLIENKVDDLFKQSMAIKKTKAGKEAKKLLVETYKLRKVEAKEAKIKAKEQEKEDKKRKRAEEKAAKSNKKGKSQGGLTFSGDLGIKTRLKPEKVLEVSKKVLDTLVKNHTIGIKEMPLDTLAVQVGYKNSRSDAVVDSMKLLKLRGTVEKISGNKIKLTQKGIEANIEEEELEIPDNPEAMVDMYWTQFETRLKQTKKGSGAKPLAAAKRVWDLLKDGEPHDMSEVLKVAEYKVENSHAIEEIKRQLRVLEFAVKENKQLVFTEKVLKPLRGEM